MAEAIVTDRALRKENREEVWRNIRMIAEMNGQTPRQYISGYLEKTEDFDFLDLDSIDWCVLFRDAAPKDEDILGD